VYVLYSNLGLVDGFIPNLVVDSKSVTFNFSHKKMSFEDIKKEMAQALTPFKIVPGLSTDGAQMIFDGESLTIKDVVFVQ
jgi:hypothetical protein